MSFLSRLSSTFLGLVGATLLLFAAFAAAPAVTPTTYAQQPQTNDDRLREEYRQRVARLPKVEFSPTQMSLYTDGFVAHETITNHTEFSLRVNLVREALFVRLRFVDEQGGTWEFPELEKHYQYRNENRENTVVIKPGAKAKLLLVNTTESPTLRQTKPQAKACSDQLPTSLKYELIWASSLYQEDMSAAKVDVARVSKGTVRVEWKKEKLPEGERSHVEELCLASKEPAAEKAPCPDVQIVVFRHHPGIIDTKERMDARRRDEEFILQALNGELSGYEYSGGLGRGYELSIHARDLGRWKSAIDKLLKAGTLKYYDRWELDRHGYGFVPVR